MADDTNALYFDLLKTEYTSVRAECQQAGVNMWTAVQWGATLLAVLFGAGLTTWAGTTVVPLIVFFILIPGFSFTTMSFWLGEAARMKRAGDYVALLEHKAWLEVGPIMKDFTSWRSEQVELFEWLRIGRKEDATVINLAGPLGWEYWLRERRGAGWTEGHLNLLYALRLGFFPIVSTAALLIGIIWRNTTTLNLPNGLVLVCYLVAGISYLATLYFAGVVGRALKKPVDRTVGIRRWRNDPSV